MLERGGGDGVAYANWSNEESGGAGDDMRVGDNELGSNKEPTAEPERLAGGVEHEDRDGALKSCASDLLWGLRVRCSEQDERDGEGCDSMHGVTIARGYDTVVHNQWKSKKFDKLDYQTLHFMII